MNRFFSSISLTALILAGIAHTAAAQWVNTMFVDSGVLYAGVSNLGVGSTPGVYASSDQGVTWMQYIHGIGKPAVYAYADIHGMLFAAADSAPYHSVSPGGIFRSSDKGASWSRILSSNAEALASDGDTLFASGNGMLYWTIDMGTSCDSIAPGFGTAAYLRSFQGILFAKTDSGLVFRSSTGGMTWEQCSIHSPSGDFATMGSDIYVVGVSGILVSSNGGVNWMPEGNGSFVSVTTGTGFVVASNSGGGVLFSTDNGMNWNRDTIGEITSFGNPDAYYNSVVGMAIVGDVLILAVVDTDAVGFLQVPLSNLDVKDAVATTTAIYPNPASNHLNCAGEVSKVELVDCMGRSVLTAKPDGADRIDLSSVPQGVYRAIIHTSSGTSIVPLAVSR